VIQRRRLSFNLRLFYFLKKAVEVELTMAGIVSKIPADDVFAAMDNTSKNMSDNIKETAEGGLAKTAAGIRIAEEIL
jgi:L-serine dehydratase